MQNPFIRKLAHSGFLTVADNVTLAHLSSRTRQVDSHRDLIREGDRPEHVRLVMKGFACRYKIIEQGRRQILAFLVPGDFCDLHVAILGEMDHNIGTLSPCIIVDIPRVVVEELTARHSRISRALWWATLVDEGILREWLVSMGQRPADQQIAHLFCELFFRLQAVGLCHNNSFDLPMTQEELADTMGLSTIHVNRTLQQLRYDGFITFKAGVLDIIDVAKLAAFSGFNPNYLHLNRRSATVD
ncbi:Crp/Fnr family transcriptional regulator [Lichenihabitans sp. PAMC28606]|uniref:Crp/Fnr family transcriptional regulator n=1 Tax=Lichenihabitans sp. PAMC28606 TaxID=2880932 RepID=UPI001D0B3822|nr:Crp/Fnr family transcriptional regulator [Lichenihabitans sp. PAMC28606]UDL95260.1 Crp/Fnr family transcriptional regulator [Lichenihabitans sp. PAMC28606]